MVAMVATVAIVAMVGISASPHLLLALHTTTTPLSPLSLQPSCAVVLVLARARASECPPLEFLTLYLTLPHPAPQHPSAHQDNQGDQDDQDDQDQTLGSRRRTSK